VKDQVRAFHFDEVKRIKGFDHSWNRGCEQCFEALVAYVARRNEQEFPRLLTQEKRFDEIGVFCYDDVLLCDREFGNHSIGGAIASWRSSV
jgi:hypothetical protein